MPEKLIAYKRMPLWTKDTMPEAVQRKHKYQSRYLGKDYRSRKENSTFVETERKDWGRSSQP